MKKLFTSLILSCTAFCSLAQYESMFGNENTVWTVIEANEFFGTNTVIWEFDTIVELNGDTAYKVDRISPNLPQSIYVKEDLQLGKAWACTANNDCYLFFDLSLEVGDTLANDDAFNCPQSVVDSVYWDNLGKKHIRFAQNHGIFNHFEMIEGIGTSAGLYKFVWGMLTDPSLICQHKNDTLNYMAAVPYVENCQYTLNALDVEYNEIMLFPNPASEVINVESEFGLQNQLYAIFNTQGIMILEGYSSSFGIDVSTIPTGYYSIAFSDNKNKHYRFIKL